MSKCFFLSLFLIIHFIGLGQNISEEPDTFNCPQRSHSDYFGSPYKIRSYYEYYEGLSCSKMSKKPYLIYFSGYGSVKSRQMEAEVWSNLEILLLLKNEFIMSTLYVDSKSSFYINKDDTLKTDGQKQVLFQKSKFHDDQYPSYYIINGKEEILAGPYYFNQSIISFKEFLKLGIKKYKENNNF